MHWRPSPLDALTSRLIGSFYGRDVTTYDILASWPSRLVNAVWTHNTGPTTRVVLGVGRRIG